VFWEKKEIFISQDVYLSFSSMKRSSCCLQGADYADDGSTKESKGSHEKGIYNYLLVKLHAKDITCFSKKSYLSYKVLITSL
jgi:hypothetical protein